MPHFALQNEDLRKNIFCLVKLKDLQQATTKQYSSFWRILQVFSADSQLGVFIILLLKKADCHPYSMRVSQNSEIHTRTGIPILWAALCLLRILFRNLAISQEKGTLLCLYKT